jgi:aminoglycoside phosphotransferase
MFLTGGIFLKTMKQQLPPKLKQLTSGYEFVPVTIGKSGAMVYKLEHSLKPNLFLKFQPSSSVDFLELEALKLEWLHKRDILVPEVIVYLEEESHEWMLTRAIPGCDASNSWNHAEIPAVLETLAESLKRLHALEIADCPFNQKLELKIAEAKHRVIENLVDETDFDDDRLGKSAQEVFQELLDKRPTVEDLVFTHGDYCLPNIMVHNLEFAGFIDLGRAGIADRYQDLALITRSLESDFNPQFNGWSQYFLAQYGIPKPEESKLEFYRLLDEFF